MDTILINSILEQAKNSGIEVKKIGRSGGKKGRKSKFNFIIIQMYQLFGLAGKCIYAQDLKLNQTLSNPYNFKKSSYSCSNVFF